MLVNRDILSAAISQIPNFLNMTKEHIRVYLRDNSKSSDMVQYVTDPNMIVEVLSEIEIVKADLTKQLQRQNTTNLFADLTERLAKVKVFKMEETGDIYYRDDSSWSKIHRDAFINKFCPKSPVTVVNGLKASLPLAKDIIFEPCPDSIIKRNKLTDGGYDLFLNTYQHQTIKDEDANMNLMEDLHSWLLSMVGDDEKGLHYLYMWMARPYQNYLAFKNVWLNRCAVVFKSLYHGTGKGTLANMLGLMYGNGWGAARAAHWKVIKSKDLKDRYDINFEKCFFIFTNEIRIHSSEFENDIKPMITDDFLSIREVWEKQKQIVNRANWMFATNETIPFKVSAQDRRFTFFETEKPPHSKVVQIAANLFEYTKTLSRFLKGYPVEDFTFSPYHTKAKDFIIKGSDPEMKQFIEHILSDGLTQAMERFRLFDYSNSHFNLVSYCQSKGYCDNNGVFLQEKIPLIVLEKLFLSYTGDSRQNPVKGAAVFGQHFITELKSRLPSCEVIQEKNIKVVKGLKV